MSSLPVVFSYEAREVRVQVDPDGNPWWVAKDVCEVLEHSNHKMAVQGLDDDEVRKVYLTDALGRQQENLTISESGLYTLIIRSNKPEAKRFRKWVTSEVLPSIRKTGGYQTETTGAAEEPQGAGTRTITTERYCQLLEAELAYLRGGVPREEPAAAAVDQVSLEDLAVLSGRPADFLAAAKMRRQGRSIREISEGLRIDRALVRQWVAVVEFVSRKKRGARKTQWTRQMEAVLQAAACSPDLVDLARDQRHPEEFLAANEMRGQGLSANFISMILGLSHTTVSRWFNRVDGRRR